MLYSHCKAQVLRIAASSNSLLLFCVIDDRCAGCESCQVASQWASNCEYLNFKTLLVCMMQLLLGKHVH
jgi:hypothetical protein